LNAAFTVFVKELSSVGFWFWGELGFSLALAPYEIGRHLYYGERRGLIGRECLNLMSRFLV
jgi:hypothetical protein